MIWLHSRLCELVALRNAWNISEEDKEQMKKNFNLTPQGSIDVRIVALAKQPRSKFTISHIRKDTCEAEVLMPMNNYFKEAWKSIVIVIT